MAEIKRQQLPFEVRSIREEDVESAGAACFAAFDHLSKQAQQLTDQPDFPNADVATGVIRTKVWKLGSGVDGIMAVGGGGQVLGGCFAEVEGEVIAVGPVFVRPEAAGQGIGKAVLAALLNKIQPRQRRSVRLVQNTMNCVSFRLYHSLGFRTVDIWSYFMGYVKPEAVTSHPGLTVRRLEEKDVPACGDLFTKATGLHRDHNIGEESAAWPSWVVTRDDEGDRVVGYRTSPVATGHGVVESEAEFIALHQAASQELQQRGGPPLTIHIMCRLHPQLVDWAFRAGLKLARQNAHMVIGEYEDPKLRPIYSPSIEC